MVKVYMTRVDQQNSYHEVVPTERERNREPFPGHADIQPLVNMLTTFAALDVPVEVYVIYPQNIPVLEGQPMLDLVSRPEMHSEN